MTIGLRLEAGYTLVPPSDKDDRLHGVEEDYALLIVSGRGSILARLFTADPEVSALRSLRKGLSVPLDLDFDLSKKLPLLKFWSAVGGAWKQAVWG